MSNTPINYTRLISFNNYELFEKQILNQILNIKKYLLIGTFNLQDLRIKINNSYIPLSEIIEKLVKKGVSIYFLLQPKACNTSFIRKMKKLTLISKNIAIKSCPRIHLKTIIIDLKLAYIGSANLTGFGLGTRSRSKRNFELGFITYDKNIISEAARNFIDIFNGKFCRSGVCFYYRNKYSKRYCEGLIEE
ncbi:MAG: phospholipase D-like domain-containing protein [Candidatus Helarchaeota archaeon]